MERLELGYDYHIPVLLAETIDLLVTDREGVYIDGTLGGGGHSEEILKRLGQNGKLICFDKDIEAIDYCKVKFKDELEKGESSRVTLLNQCYSKIIEIVRGGVQGILLDLGISSRQLDASHRGFSYRANSRLGMNFDSQGRSAEEFINAAKEDEITLVLRKYGEEPFARAIARRIVQRRRASPLKTTFDLKSIVEEVVPPRLLNKSLSRVFQAIRIHINDELTILENTLANIIPILKISGRIAVISYHSLEDRIVKDFFRKNQVKKSAKNKYKDENVEKFHLHSLKILTSKPITPSKSEVELNPRSRSAKLRVAERVA